MCSAFIFSVLICSFNTPTRPSRVPFSMLVSLRAVLASPAAASSPDKRASRVSYSTRICSEACLVSSKSFDTMAAFSSVSFNWLRVPAVSIRNWFTSYFFKSSFKRRYSFAASDCFARGPTCFSSSVRISVTRTRFCFSSSSFFWAMAFLRLNFTIPAASSKSSRRSSGLPLNILSIWPCPMME